MDYEKQKIIKWVFRIFLVGIITVIFLFSNQIGSQSNKISNEVARIIKIDADTDYTLSTQPLLFGISIRGCAHIFLYAVMGLFVYGVLGKCRLRWLKAVLICYIYACIDEMHQYFIPGRTAKLADTLYDALGFVTVITLCCLVDFMLRKRKRVH